MKVLLSLTLTVSLLSLVGCSRETATTPPPAADTVDDHGHDHSDGEAHDHSVAGHAHGPGPHDGVVADWGGGKYHVEFTVDHDTTEATVYVLGGDEVTPSPIDAESIEVSIADPEVVVTLDAAPQAGDPEGTASRYIGKHEKLAVVQEYEGTITGLVDGTPYSGDFKEEAHEH
ncbi:MAG: hypothetical protein ACF788_02460 [Novipirellula sp. JB048]